MGEETIITIIVLLAGLVGFIVRVARPRLWRTLVDAGDGAPQDRQVPGTSPARKTTEPSPAREFQEEEPAGREPAGSEPAGEVSTGEMEEMAPRDNDGTGAEQDEELPAREEPRRRARVETEPAMLSAPAPAAVDASTADRTGAGAQGSRGGWSRIMSLPPLKRAIVLSELLGKPKALSEERFP